MKRIALDFTDRACLYLNGWPMPVPEEEVWALERALREPLEDLVCKYRHLLEEEEIKALRASRDTIRLSNKS